MVSADYSYDIGSLPLTYHWVILRGDKDKIKIIPRNEHHSIVEIQIQYFEKYKDPDYDIFTNRVEIGAFVHNGTFYSAPGFVTIFSFANELRTYDEKGRILEIGYNVGDTEIGYDIKVKGAEFSILSSGYDIKDWKALLNFIVDGKSNTLMSRLIKSKIDDRYDQPISQCAEKLNAYFQRIKLAKSDPSLGKNTIQSAKQDAYTFLTQNMVNEQMSVKALIESALNAIKNDVRLYVDNQIEIHQLVDNVKIQKAHQNFYKLRERLLKLGILKENNQGTFRIQSIRKGSFPIENTLTKYERNQLEWLNITLMNSILYPQFMNKKFKMNAVDMRLSVPKAWFRDVYYYDENGALAGWSRYREEGTTKYDSKGNLENGKIIEYKIDQIPRSSKGTRYNRQIVPVVSPHSF